jgi:transcriptional regulator GlxA family with amidase domain
MTRLATRSDRYSRKTVSLGGSSGPHRPRAVAEPSSLEMLRKLRDAEVERDLINAWAGCHATSEIQASAAGAGPRHEVMQRFHSILDAAPGRPIYVLEMAAAIGTSLRSLSESCEEQVGIGPERYLMLRRLHLARRALCAADPATTTVPDVATRYGFWWFGQFSRQYKSFFGELPSDTLRRVPVK